MTRKLKNKASKCWIFEDKEFWGPVTIALGITAFSNGIITLSNFANVSPTPINGWINPLTICINLLCGLTFTVLGFWITPRKDRKLWSRILITAGLAIFFFGTRIVSLNLIMFIIGWFIILCSFTLLGRGFWLYCRNKKQGQGE